MVKLRVNNTKGDSITVGEEGEEKLFESCLAINTGNIGTEDTFLILATSH